MKPIRGHTLLTPRLKRSAAVLAALTMTVTACGLKGELTLDPQGGLGIEGAAGPRDDFDDGLTDDGFTDDVDLDTGAPRDGAVRGPDGGPTDELPPGVTATGLFERETEGVTADELRMCAHVPITGAAPIPHHEDRFGQFYWNAVNAEQGGLHGRRVRFTAHDDQYNPPGARAAVERCARQGAFMYFGAAGTDQIVSVARWAEGRKVPYFHGPASIKDLNDLVYNVHVGPTYEYQHELLADYLVDRFGADTIFGAVRIDSPFFEAGINAFRARLEHHGARLAVSRRVQKDERTFTDIWRALQNADVQVVNNFTTPQIWINMLAQRLPGYNPWKTAVSPVAGFNIVAQALQESGARAVVFHHFNPACECFEMDGAPRNLPYYDEIQEFMRVFRRYSPEQTPPADDFDFASYLGMKGIHRILEKLGPDPTRSGLFNLLDGYTETREEAWPGCPGDFTRTQDERIGAWGTHIFELTRDGWKQIETCHGI